MTKGAKKLFPNFKKKLQSFLTDESWKITKKDALGLAAGGVFLWLAEDAGSHNDSNWHHHSWVGHGNTACGHLSQAAMNWYSRAGHVSAYNRWATISQGHASGYAAWGHVSGARTAHSSWIVNGHSSSSPSGGHVSGYNRWATISQGHASGFAAWGHVSGYSRGWHVSRAAINSPRHCNSPTSGHSSHSSSGSWDSGS